MKKSTYIWAMIVSLALTACGSSVKTKLIGSWKLDAQVAGKFSGTSSESEEEEQTNSEKSTKKDAPIIGKWKLIAIEGKKLSEKDKDATMEFAKNGTFKQTKGDKMRKGEWEVSKDKKTIKISINGKTEKMSVLKYKNNQLTLADNVNEFVFKKINAQEDETEDTEKTIKKKVAEEGVLEFRKDETFVISVGKTTINGKWEVAKDNKSVTLSPEKGISETMSIVKLDANEFTFRGSKESTDATIRKK